MKNLAITSCLAIALALGTGARPAAALEGEELLGLIIGLGALAAIGNELADRRDERAKPAPAVPHARYRHARPRHRALPAACLRTVDTYRGERRVFGARCLARNDVRLARLPDRCRFDIRTNRGFRPVYGSRCLRREGYTVARYR